MKYLLLTLLTVSVSLNIVAGEVSNGAELFNKNCIKCHQTPANFTRKNKKTKSYSALKKRVKQCGLMVGASLFDDEVESITNYLNQQYYHYAK